MAATTTTRVRAAAGQREPDHGAPRERAERNDRSSEFGAEASIGSPPLDHEYAWQEPSAGQPYHYEAEHEPPQEAGWQDQHAARGYYGAEIDPRAIAQAAERGAILGTRRLDKVRTEWREFARRFESTALTASELRRLRLDLRRREMLLFLLGGFVLVMGTLYGALIFSSPQLLGNPRSELGCTMFGGSWAETSTQKEYCIFWAN